jgi:hypothetical protein
MLSWSSSEAGKADSASVPAVFTPSARYKARRVTRLLHLERSRHRIVTTQLNHLVQQGRLM